MTSPQITATFVLDANGVPERIESGNLTHYKIRLKVDNAPEDTYAVTYRLHDSYHTPVREAIDRATLFAEDLTSYGDYSVQAKVRTRDGAFSVARDLSRALEAGHADALTGPIVTALNEIKGR